MMRSFCYDSEFYRTVLGATCGATVLLGLAAVVQQSRIEDLQNQVTALNQRVVDANPVFVNRYDFLHRRGYFVDTNQGAADAAIKDKITGKYNPHK